MPIQLFLARVPARVYRMNLNMHVGWEQYSLILVHLYTKVSSEFGRGNSFPANPCHENMKFREWSLFTGGGGFGANPKIAQKFAHPSTTAQHKSYKPHDLSCPASHVNNKHSLTYALPHCKKLFCYPHHIEKMFIILIASAIKGLCCRILSRLPGQVSTLLY